MQNTDASRRGRVRRFAVGGAGLVAMVSAMASVGVFAASAQGPPPEENVEICHRTDSATNPYVLITVAVTAVDGTAGNSGGEPDHFGEHTGPLVTTEAEAQALKDAGTEWGDIIPPVAGHQGLNWPAGQAILENDCNLVPPVTTTTAPPVVVQEAPPPPPPPPPPLVVRVTG